MNSLLSRSTFIEGRLIDFNRRSYGREVLIEIAKRIIMRLNDENTI